MTRVEIIEKKMKRHKLALHVFRRDLRLGDNTALIYALENSDKVIPCFVFDKRQVKEHAYKSNNALQFMIFSLQDLDHQLRKRGGKLYLFYGIAEEVIEKLVSSLEIDLVTLNRDYTPFSTKRDGKIQSILKQKNVEYSYHADALLNEPEAVHKDDLNPYTIFTPFRKKAQTFPARLPMENRYTNYYSKKIENQKQAKIFNQILPQKNPNISLDGGRKEGLKLLRNLSRLSDYEIQRDYPAQDYTSHLSAHIKFGTVSIREVYHQIKNLLGDSHTLITELHWRDFFTHITYHFPRVIGSSFHEKYNNIKWDTDKDLFKAWCEGKTGYPIVDAGMRELNVTGYMHNRARMITASFLVKDLHIDWRWGERYFAQNLIDYDPAVNNGNWQWAASTGCDAQPYFRIFNPWRQQQKFDPDCDYIKKWIPELKYSSRKEIHNLERQRPMKELLYPKPIVDHKAASSTAKAMYALVAKKS
jgi:deoxyribodipyrimidine photo-lyase